MEKAVTILGIESSCDDTSAAIVRDGYIHSNEIADQEVHRAYGGVVPELASRAHQKNIIPVVDAALKKANVERSELSAIAYTRGPGLMGSLLVGSSFAQSFSMALGVPLIEVNHMLGHIHALFIRQTHETHAVPTFPFLCLTVSGGHTQIVKVTDYFDVEVLGETLDDAAGEAFDKVAKMLGLGYPGGPVVDRLAQGGNPNTFQFNIANIDGLDFSFSGFKTSFLYLVQRELKKAPNFIEENLNDLCASAQATIIKALMNKLEVASMQTGIKEIAIAGGVSANRALREALNEQAVTKNWTLHIPPFEYCTDNAGMIAMTGYFSYIQQKFASTAHAPIARLKL